MITRYKITKLFKNKEATNEPGSKVPFYDMLAEKDGEKNSSINVGRFWFKESESGVKYFSGKLNDVFTTKENKTYPGYVIVREDELDELEKKASSPTVEGKGYTGEVNIDDIPF